MHSDSLSRIDNYRRNEKLDKEFERKHREMIHEFCLRGLSRDIIQAITLNIEAEYSRKCVEDN